MYHGHDDMEASSPVLPHLIGLDEIESPIVRQGLEYWRKQCSDRDLPLVAEFRPADVARILPNIAMIHVEHETGDFEFRVLGERVNQALGHNFKGAHIADLNRVKPGYGDGVRSFYEGILRTRQPAAMAGSLAFVNRDHGRFEVVCLPFSETGERVDRLISVSDHRVVVGAEDTA